jgi:putative hemolysin
MDSIQIILFVALFLLSAFFSWTELALMGLADHKLESLFKKNKFWSKSLKKIKKNNDRLLITILIWNNLVNTFTAAFATTIAIWLWQSWWMGLSQATAVWLATWIVTFLLLVFGEIIPKSIATKNAAKIALIVAPIYSVLMILLYPIITLLEIIIKIFSKKWHIEKVTEDEVESFIDIWKESWAIKHDDHEKIKSILDFANTDVEEIMTPRVQIEALPNNTSVKDAFNFFLKHTHSRIPVYSKTIDKITHMMTIRDILSIDEDTKLKDLELREVLRVPLNQHIDSLLKTFQNSRKHLAIVMDEYGWVAGLITLEDIMEEIFWEIRDETDREVDDIREIGTDSLVVKSDVLFEDVLNKLGITYKSLWLSEKEFSWETLSYMVTEKLKRFPSNWEKIIFKIYHAQNHECTKIEFKVLDVVDSKMWSIEIKKS